MIQKTQNFKVTMYNSNGSETGACGNGTRCVADYLMKRDNLNSLNIQSISGNLTCTKTDNVVTVNMGEPKFDWKDIPLASEQNITITKSVGGKQKKKRKKELCEELAYMK